MKDLKSILSTILGANPYYQGHRHEILVFEKWAKAVGPRIAQHCRPERLCEDGTLIIGSPSSAWLHQLRYLERKIIANLNKELKQEIVKQLRFKALGDLRP